jgi:hypothetical protein
MANSLFKVLIKVFKTDKSEGVLLFVSFQFSFIEPKRSNFVLGFSTEFKVQGDFLEDTECIFADIQILTSERLILNNDYSGYFQSEDRVGAEGINKDNQRRGENILLSDKVSFLRGHVSMESGNFDIQLGHVSEPSNDDFLGIYLLVELEHLSVIFFIKDKLRRLYAMLLFYLILGRGIFFFIFILLDEGNNIAISDVNMCGFDSSEQGSDHIFRGLAVIEVHQGEGN